LKGILEMRFFVYRRVRNLCLLLLALATVGMLVRAMERSLHPATFVTGYLLFGAVLFLALYNVRKKLPSVPLGNSATWLQWHVYVGLGSLVLFGLHLGWKVPTGGFDVLLAGIYLLTFGSGLVGLYLTRTIPAQLAHLGEEVIYERAPAIRQQVWRQANETALEAVTASGATTLADFYAARLYDFFGRSRGWAYVLRPTTIRRRNLMREMQDLRRYLAEQEQASSERLFSLVRRKDDIDFAEARQRLLKLWLFGHIALSYTLMLLGVLHGLLAHAFRGGAA
jgi:hypothetical protein